jgi:uncharacterized protein YjhX (UPF0386 family)
MLPATQHIGRIDAAAADGFILNIAFLNRQGHFWCYVNLLVSKKLKGYL